MAALHFSILMISGFAALQGALSCSLPPGACLSSKCGALKTLAVPNSATMDTKIGFYYGVWNKNINGGNSTGFESARGGAFVNYEVFPAIEKDYLITGVNTSSAISLDKCCTLCAQTAGCALFQFFTDGNWANIVTGFGAKALYGPANFVLGQQCYLLTGGSQTGPTEGTYGSPFSGTHSQQISDVKTAVPNKYYAPSWVGGDCNPNASVVNDPHFVGAHGTQFDFNGELDKAFCLVTDEKLQINIKLGGYEDSRTVGATLLPNGKALRTWIKEVGILWKSSDGARHTALLVARKGKDEAVGDGFLAGLVVDGEALPVPKEGEVAQQGMLSVENAGVERKGVYDVQSFTLRVWDLLELGVKMRPAHPLLQSEDDAQIHFNLHLNSFEPTSNVHGVLGQTFRNTATQFVKALEYKLLGRLLGGPIAADGASGSGFLEGEPADYGIPDPLNPGCKFSAFA